MTSSLAALFHAQVQARIRMTSPPPSLRSPSPISSPSSPSPSTTSSFSSPSLDPFLFYANREQMKDQLAYIPTLSISADSLTDAFKTGTSNNPWPMRSYFCDSNYFVSENDTGDRYPSPDEMAPSYIHSSCPFYGSRTNSPTEDKQIEMEGEDQDDAPDTVYGNLQSQLREELGKRPDHSDVVARFMQNRISHYQSADRQDHFYDKFHSHRQ